MIFERPKVKIFLFDDEKPGFLVIYTYKRTVLVKKVIVDLVILIGQIDKSTRILRHHANGRNQSGAATVGRKIMESVLTLLTLSSILLFTSSVDARKGPAEYWKDVMKDQPMPEAIQGLLYSKPGSLSPLENQKQEEYHSDSYIQTNSIIYHGLGEQKVEKNLMEDSELNRSNSSLHIRQEEKNLFRRRFNQGLTSQFTMNN
ncbi:hypothetical protein NE237_022528 [Protea cynaroides]|uniref:Uncharacterized protein n=1 Tax=Protea cynaroides TaxID=273540 RepID=A0A9Q0HFB5_9MAGN|nr:hypothetical protein NE237_022528 [Protea cynaroides]